MCCKNRHLNTCRACVTTVHVIPNFNHNLHILSSPWILKSYITGGIDYDPGPYDVKITKGSKRKFFSIDIINDDIYNGKRDFVIAIDKLPLGLVRGDPYETTIEISDDECK